MTDYLKTSNAVTVGFLLAMCWHFGTVLGLFGVAPIGQVDLFVRLGLILGTTVVVAFIVSYVFVKKGQPLQAEEREEKIERYSEGVGTLVIYFGFLLLVWFAFAPMSPAQCVNGLLLVVSVAELLKLLVVLALHRREFV